MFCGVSFGCCDLYSFPESTLTKDTSTKSAQQWLDSCQALSEGCACVQPCHWCMLLSSRMMLRLRVHRSLDVPTIPGVGHQVFNDLNADAVVTFVQCFSRERLSAGFFQ